MVDVLKKELNLYNKNAEKVILEDIVTNDILDTYNEPDITLTQYTIDFKDIVDMYYNYLKKEMSVLVDYDKETWLSTIILPTLEEYILHINILFTNRMLYDLPDILHTSIIGINDDVVYEELVKYFSILLIDERYSFSLYSVFKKLNLIYDIKHKHDVTVVNDITIPIKWYSNTFKLKIYELTIYS